VAYSWNALKFFFCTKLALEVSAIPFSHVSFALTFSSTSRVSMSASMVNFYLLYSSEVAKFFQESGNLEIIPPATNLSGNTHGDSLLQFLRSFTSVCIS
jgi:hypothetical protein